MYVYRLLACRAIANRPQPKERKGSYFFTEFRAGLATFFAMAYIISVNCEFPVRECDQFVLIMILSLYCV